MSEDRPIERSSHRRLLLDEPPLLILPTLATKVGVDCAIFLQQLHYWINKCKDDPTKLHDGRIWTYNTYRMWQENFPFWSERTIRRIVKKLRNTGLVLIGNFNYVRSNQTLWYTICYENLDRLCGPDIPEDLKHLHLDTLSTSSGQNGRMDVASVANSLSETSSEITSEKDRNVSRASARDENELRKKDFVLRPDEKEFELFVKSVQQLIDEENRRRPNNRFIWKPTRQNPEIDLKQLLYGNLSGCKTREATDERKRSLLLEVMSIQGFRLNWPNYVLLAIRYTIKASERKPIHKPLGFVTSVLLKPALIVSSIAEGRLKVS